MAAGPILVYAPLNLNNNAISNVANPVNNQDVVTKSWFLANQPGVIWDNVSGKPLVFPPDTHVHAISDITSLESALLGKEASLGNPTVDGYVLSSTIAGVRSWVASASGSGVPNGGTDGQVLTKLSSTDGDVDWETPTGGSGLPNGGTIGQVLTKLSATDGDAGWHNSDGSIGDVVIGHKSISTSDYLASSSVIPNDDTIPQQTEGTELLTLTYTPRSSTSILKIEAEVSLYQASSASAVVALFRDSTLDTIGATLWVFNSGANIHNSHIIAHVPSTALTETVFKLRVGPCAAGTVKINGGSALRLLGGATVSSLYVTELEEIGGVSGNIKSTSTVTTGSLASATIEATTIAISSVSEILKITSSCASWIRIYGSSAQLTADSSRLITEDVVPNSGCYFDGIFDSSHLTINCNPVPIFVNEDTVLTNIAYISIQNLELTSQAVTINLEYLHQETKTIVEFGVPTGGTTGQSLVKLSNTNGDTGWINPVEDTYSLSETLTNKIWLGSPVYRKVINFGTLPISTTKNVAHGITGDFMLTAPPLGVAYNPTTYVRLSLPNANPTSSNNIQVYVDNTNVVVVTGLDRSAYTSSYVILEYTKS